MLKKQLSKLVYSLERPKVLSRILIILLIEKVSDIKEEDKQRITTKITNWISFMYSTP